MKCLVLSQLWEAAAACMGMQEWKGWSCEHPLPSGTLPVPCVGTAVPRSHSDPQPPPPHLPISVSPRDKGKSSFAPQPPVLPTLTHLASERTFQFHLGGSGSGLSLVAVLIAGIAWSNSCGLIQHRKVPPLRANLLALDYSGKVYCLLFI